MGDPKCQGIHLTGNVTFHRRSIWVCDSPWTLAVQVLAGNSFRQYLKDSSLGWVRGIANSTGVCGEVWEGRRTQEEQDWLSELMQWNWESRETETSRVQGLSTRKKSAAEKTPEICKGPRWVFIGTHTQKNLTEAVNRNITESEWNALELTQPDWATSQFLGHWAQHAGGFCLSSSE